MPASIAKNEINSAKRECDLIVYKNDGTLAPRGTDFIALGMLYVGGPNRPHFSQALGVLTNKRIPLTIADDTIESVDATADTATLTAHLFETGDGPVRLTTTGTLPAGLELVKDYWLIKDGTNTVKFADSLANAYAGTVVDITGTGSGTHTIDVTLSSQRGQDGMFTYQFTQNETNFDGSELSVMVEGTNYSRALGGGTYTSVQFGSTVQGFETTAEGAHAFGDLMRLMTSVLAGPVTDFTTGTLIFKSLDGSKTRLTVTVGPTGRLTITVGDLT